MQAQKHALHTEASSRKRLRCRRGVRPNRRGAGLRVPRDKETLFSPNTDESARVDESNSDVQIKGTESATFALVLLPTTPVRFCLQGLFTLRHKMAFPRAACACML